MENKEQPKLDIDKCPVCGSTKRLSKEVLESEHRAGKAMLASNAYLFRQESLISNPNMQFLSATVILSFFDACMDCGTVYCVHAETKLAVQGMGKAPQNQPPFSLS